MRILLVSINFVFILLTVHSFPRRYKCDFYHSKENLTCIFFRRENESTTGDIVNRTVFVRFNESLVKGFCNISDVPNISSVCVYSPKLQLLQVKVEHECYINKPLHVMVEENGNDYDFSIIPCELDTFSFNYQFKVNISYTGFDLKMKSPFTHENHYIINASCLPMSQKKFAQPFHKIYRIHPDISTSLQQPVSGLTPSTYYNCSIKAKYVRSLPLCGDGKRICETRWHFAKSQIIRTLDKAPSYGPVFYDGMFQEEDGSCYVYFMPVPLKERNGKVSEYRCDFNGGELGPTEFLNFASDCSKSRFSCELKARNQYGWGENKTIIQIKRTDAPLPELELWRTDKLNEYNPKIKVPESINITRSIILICECKICESKHPDCISMKTMDLTGDQTIHIDFSRERAAVLVLPQNGQTVPMSKWVGCSYDSTAGAGEDAWSEIRKVLTSKTFHEHYKEISIPTAALRCNYSYDLKQPIDQIYSRQKCGDNEPRDQKYKRPIGKTMMNFDVHIFERCRLSLSLNGRKFFPLDSTGKKSDIVIPIIAVAVIILIVVVTAICCKKRRVIRQRCHEYRNQAKANYRPPEQNMSGPSTYDNIPAYNCPFYSPLSVQESNNNETQMRDLSEENTLTSGGYISQDCNHSSGKCPA